MTTAYDSHPFTVTGDAGIRLRCRRWGESPRVVVAVHGMNAHGLHWRRPAERLAPRYSLVGYDLRGHGDSDKPPTGYSFDDHADDLGAVIERVATAPPVVIGHSLGARIALVYAARHPLRGLVVVDPGIVLLDRHRQAQTHRAPAGRRPGLTFEYESEAAYMAYMRRTKFLRNWSPYAEEYARYAIEPAEHGGVRLKFRPHVLRETVAALRTLDLLTFLKHIACPTLIIRATEGHLRADVAERMVQELPDGRLAVVEGANHNVMLDKPEAFEPLIEDFLDEVCGRDARAIHQQRIV